MVHSELNHHARSHDERWCIASATRRAAFSAADELDREVVRNKLNQHVTTRGGA
jgi:hypothetical protein